MNKSEVTQILRDQKPYLAEQFFVKKIGIFGSYARNENTDNSDSDILVEFDRPVGFEFIRLKDYLESLFDKPVDLVTEGALKPIIKEQILDEVQYQ